MNQKQAIEAYKDMHREVFGFGCSEGQATEMLDRLRPVLSQVDPVSLTRRQKEALDVIRAHIDEHGVAPSLKELADRLHCGQANASALLTHLVNKGLIRRLRHHARSMEVVSAPKK